MVGGVGAGGAGSGRRCSPRAVEWRESWRALGGGRERAKEGEREREMRGS